MVLIELGVRITVCDELGVPQDRQMPIASAAHVNLPQKRLDEVNLVMAGFMSAGINGRTVETAIIIHFGKILGPSLVIPFCRTIPPIRRHPPRLPTRCHFTPLITMTRTGIPHQRESSELGDRVAHCRSYVRQSVVVAPERPPRFGERSYKPTSNLRCSV